MKNARLLTLILIAGLLSSPISAQRRQPLQCTEKNTGNESMTYLVGAGKLSKAEKKRIKEKFGVLVVPKGETERAKQVRARALAYRQQQIDVISQSFELWMKLNPKATADEIESHQKQKQNFLSRFSDERYKTLIKQENWDWRVWINVGPVMNQGRGCNTCWAFASSSAAAASIARLDWMGADAHFLLNEENGEFNAVAGGMIRRSASPFVQDLLNCMPIKAEEICQSGWHGEAFDFMVYKAGIPIAYEDGFTGIDKNSGKTVTYRRQYLPGQKFACQPTKGFAKAVSWDYVNSPPDKLPTVEQLKLALVEHGPLVAPIFYDECLGNYKGGVFN